MVTTWLPLPQLLDHHDDGPPAPTGLGELLRLIEAHRPAWHHEAACVGAGPAVFFPERGQSDATARRLCDACPVTAECLADALQRPERDCPGIWGGTSARERRRLRQDVTAAA